MDHTVVIGSVTAPYGTKVAFRGDVDPAIRPFLAARVVGDDLSGQSFPNGDFVVSKARIAGDFEMMPEPLEQRLEDLEDMVLKIGVSRGSNLEREYTELLAQRHTLRRPTWGAFRTAPPGASAATDRRGG